MGTRESWVSPLAEGIDPNNVVYGANELREILPHAYPFFFVDRLVHLAEDDTRIIGLKNFTVNEPFMQGHFPRLMIVPGVIVLEAIFQVTAIMGIRVMDKQGKMGEDDVGVLSKADDVRFLAPVMPGDQVIMDVHFLRRKFNVLKARGFASVGHTKVMECEVTTNLTNYKSLIASTRNK